MKKALIGSLLIMFSCFYVLAQESTLNQTDSKGLKQGRWEEKTASGISKGKYNSDQKEGTWVTYGSNGTLTRVEEFSNGIRDGIFVEIDQRGYLVSDMFYQNNLLEGTAKKYYYGTNPASIIDYRHGKINGKKKIYYENAASKLTEESEYKDDVKDGYSNFFATNGDPIAEYIYKNGLLEGIQKTYYTGKKLMSEQMYVNNIESGFYKEYFESTKPKIEGNFKEGKMTGKWVEYFESGTVKSEGTYLDGVKEGKWLEYDEAGKVVKTSKFVKGVEK
jgi:uncharacterized protein